MSERKRVSSPWWPEVDEAEPYDGRSYGAGVSFGREQALREIRDRGDVIVSRELAETLDGLAAEMTRTAGQHKLREVGIYAERLAALLLAVSDV